MNKISLLRDEECEAIVAGFSNLSNGFLASSRTGFSKVTTFPITQGIGGPVVGEFTAISSVSAGGGFLRGLEDLRFGNFGYVTVNV